MYALDPNWITAQYRAALVQFEGVSGVAPGVLIRRYTGLGTNRPKFDYGPVPARVLEYKPEDIVGDVKQGDIRVILFAQDLFAAGYSGSLKGGDKVVISRGGRLWETNIEDPDGNTRRFAGTVIAYEARCRGALE